MACPAFVTWDYLSGRLFPCFYCAQSPAWPALIRIQ